MTTMRIVPRLMVPAILGVVVLSMISATTASAATSSAKLVPGAAGKPGIVAHERSLGPLGPLTDLVIQRLLVGDQVAAAKFGTGQPIDDPVREKQELAAVRQSAISLGLNPDAAVTFFQQQINASKVVQQGLFDRWTAHPDQAPTSRPDLGTIRTELDQLTTELLQQLVAQQPVLSHEFGCWIDLGLADATGEFLSHVDALHRHALQVALLETCTGW
jgi:chorismate mutase-like protein